MAGMTTVLTGLNDKDNSRTWYTSGHTVAKPRLVIQKRRVPVGNQIVQEDTISVIQAGVDAAGLIISQKVSFQAVVRQPINVTGTTVTDSLAIFRDIVAGDEFANLLVSKSGYVKPA